MLPPPRPKIAYEQVVVDEWIKGTISEIEYDMEHKSMFKGVEKVGPAVRIKLTLDGYKFPKSSGWMAFVYAAKANLFKTYISQLVNDARTDMKFDLDLLKDMPIKVMFVQNDEYQNVSQIRPLGEKINANTEPAEDAPEAEEIPF